MPAAEPGLTGMRFHHFQKQMIADRSNPFFLSPQFNNFRDRRGGESPRDFRNALLNRATAKTSVGWLGRGSPHSANRRSKSANASSVKQLLAARNSGATSCPKVRRNSTARVTLSQISALVPRDPHSQNSQPRRGLANRHCPGRISRLPMCAPTLSRSVQGASLVPL